MALQILVFGSLAEEVGSKSIEMATAADTHTLLSLLLSTYPSLNGKTFAISIDKKIITENTPIHASAEIALLPPFSGG